MVELINAPNELKGKVNLTSSKSISNRALIAKHVSGLNTEIKNLSHAEDTLLLKKILSDFKDQKLLHCENAGTTIRFLTSFLSIQDGNWELTGSKRMQKRPINDLVSSLNELGAEISYKENVGFPPLIISGNKKIKKNKISISGAISSQFISSLLLIAPSLENGLEVEIIEPFLSKPYVTMTLSVMNEMGIKSSWIDNKIIIKKQPYKANSFVVENDWSGASFWYSFVALSSNGAIEIPYLNKNSIQGDSILSKIYLSFGVQTTFSKNGISIKKTSKSIDRFNYNLSDYPDLALPIAVSCVGLGIDCELTGLESLKHKESDRLSCLKSELEKFNISSEVSTNSMKIKGNQLLKSSSKMIKTYKDHRIAMSIAPLIMKTKNIKFDDKLVVEKSYPLFWEDMKQLHFKMKL